MKICLQFIANSIKYLLKIIIGEKYLHLFNFYLFIFILIWLKKIYYKNLVYCLIEYIHVF